MDAKIDNRRERDRRRRAVIITIEGNPVLQGASTNQVGRLASADIFGATMSMLV